MDMFTTKQQVDKHVESILRQRSSESERRKQYFNIAILYTKIKDYHTALRYLREYLSVFPDFYKAYTHCGQIYEALKEPQKALEAYKRSLILNEQQKDVLVKICQLYCDTEVDRSTATFWADQLERAYPRHELLLRLKEKIYSLQNSEENVKELESLYNTELSKHPDDLNIHIKLLKLYMNHGRVNEAYTKAVRVETSGSLKTNIDWYRCLLEVYEKYKEDSGENVNGDFHIQLLWAQHQLVSLSLERARVGDCVEALKMFDQTLYTTMSMSPTDQWHLFQQEMAAQVYFLAGVLLLKKAKEGCLSNSDATRLCSPCFLLSYAVLPPNIKAAWYTSASNADKAWYRCWYDVGCFRACQSGHMIRNLAGKQIEEWINQVQEELCNHEGKSRLFEVLFKRSRNDDNKQRSFLFKNSLLTTFSPRIPTDQDLKALDQATEHLNPDSLHHTVWRALQYYNIRDDIQPNYNLHLFDKLQYGTVKLDAAFPDTLCQLDVEAFLYAATWDVANQLQVALQQHDKPRMLPVSISDTLPSPTQAKWWATTYQIVHSQNKEQQAELRRVLQAGLEKIRLIGKHGLSAVTLSHLARTFTERLRENRSVPHEANLVHMIDDQNALQARVEHYWNGAIKILEKLQQKKSVPLPSYQLFTNSDHQLNDEDIEVMLNEARHSLAVFLKENDNFEDAIKLFEKVPLPESAFEQGLCYKLMAMEIEDRSYDSHEDRESPQERALLERALDCFKRVLDQLGTDHKHPLYIQAGDEYEELATCLEKLTISEEPSESSMTPDFGSSPGYSRHSQFCVTPQKTLMSHAVNRSQLQSTPKSNSMSSYSQKTPMRRTQPSPERLDIQLQMLSRSNKEMHMEFKKSRKTSQRLEGHVDALERSYRKLDETVYNLGRDLKDKDSLIESLESSYRKLDETVRNLGSELKEEDRLLQSMKNQNEKKEEEISKLKKSYEEMKKELHQLKEDFQSQTKALQEAVKSVQEFQRSSVTLPQHLQQAQANGMMLPPGGLPAFYGNALRTQRGLMTHQYQTAYGGYPSEYEPYIPRYAAPPSMIPSPYVGSTSQDMHERTAREAVPEVLHSIATEYDENGYDEEAESTYNKQDQLPQKRHTVKEPALQANTMYSPRGPQAAGVTSQHTPVDMIGSGSQVYQQYGQAVGHHIPGPGFFSVLDPPIATTPSSAAQNSGQTQATSALSAQRNLDPPADTLTSTSNQAVSAASVSGANLFMMPKGEVSTSFPMPMPAAAKPPNATSLTSMVKQPAPVITKSPNKCVDEADKETDGESTTPETSFTDFKPLVSLPEVITVSGEEDETVMFSERGKLYRFVEKQWKERGLGTIKILHNEEKGTVRVLMRRDQVLKVCANHRIKSDMDIDYKDPNDKKTLTWRALDYTDEEQRLEQFCCRFKTPEIAAKFKEVFEKARDIAKKNVTPKKTDVSAMVNVTSKLSAPNETQTALPSSQQEEASLGLTTSSTKPVFSFGSMSFGTKPMTPATDMLRSFAAKSTEGEPDEGQKAFGGFTFSAPPVIKSTDATDDKVKTKAEGQNKQNEQQKVFGGFMFQASPMFKDAEPTESKAVTKGDGQKSEGDNKFKPFAGFTFGFNKEKSGFDLKPSSGEVGSDSGCLKYEVDGKSDQNEQEAGAGTEDEYEPDVDFKPVVTLPSNVKQVTGEEDEEKLFGERAKLYINDPESKQWKERGIGEIKILKNSLKNTFRILMRREQVLKVCANHHITKDMKLLPLDENDKSWCWAAEDFSEDEARVEQFAVLFKNSEIANKFKKVFEKCVSHAVSKSTEETAPQPAEPLATLFQKKPGEWTCDACYVQNQADAKKCVACETVKPGEKVDEPEPVTSTTSGITLGKSGGFQFSGLAGKTFSFGSTQFQSAATSTSTLSTTATGNKFSFSGKPSFGTANFGNFGQVTQERTPAITSEEMEKKAVEKPTAGNSFGEKFKPKPGEWTCEACYVQNKADADTCVACQSSKLKTDKSTTVYSTFDVGSGSSFHFASSSKSVFGQSAKVESVADGHAGCTSSKPLDLSKEKTKCGQEVSCSESTKASFGGKGEFTFSMMTPDREDAFQKTPKTPTTPLSAGDEGYYVNQEGEDDHIYFPPVVKLPENVEIRTGEEDEELLYYQRAKLFRFVDGEWKERGVGEVRILRHKQTGRTRILMRRDQVLKICMNHALTAELELKPMINTNGRAWVWYAEDFSEDKLVHEQFAIRFKSVELANEFKEAFDKARDDPKSLPVVQHIPDPKHSKSDTRQSTPVKSEKSTLTPKSTTSATFSFKSPDSTTSTLPSVFGQGSNKSTPISAFGHSPTSVFGSSQVFGAANEPSSRDKSDSRTGAGAGLLAKLLAEPTKDVLPLTAVSNSGGAGGGSGSSSGCGDDDNDVLIVKVEEIAKERLEEARKWQLPDGFYLFEKRPPCKGCLGCLTDEFDFNTIGSKGTVQVPRRTVKSPSRRPAVEDKGSAVSKTEADSSTKEDVVQFGNASLFGDFAALAAKAGNTFAFGKSSDSKSAGWAGAGTTLFSSIQQKSEKQKSNGTSGGDEDNEEVEESPDIHFEPIVQLPEVVDLKTGEEEEEVLYRQRAKLYRFDNDQWKERGIGEMKILKNKNTERFRLLMRREQVLKVACNHALTVDMVLKPLQTSETAWCWYAVDHTENEPRNEHFAIRFKNKELAAAFKEKFTECQQILRSQGKACMPSNGNRVEENSDCRNDAGDESDECESNEVEPLFTKRATMYYVEDNGSAQQVAMGDLMVLHDEDIDGARIRMKSDKNEIICNHVICRNYQLQCDLKEKSCQWKALDFLTDEPKRRCFKVQFSSSSAAEEFQQAFDKGLDMARSVGIDEMKEGEGVLLTGELTQPPVAGYETTD